MTDSVKAEETYESAGYSERLSISEGDLALVADGSGHHVIAIITEVFGDWIYAAWGEQVRRFSRVNPPEYLIITWGQVRATAYTFIGRSFDSISSARAALTPHLRVRPTKNPLN